MSVVSLESFHRQLCECNTDSVADIIGMVKDGSFALCIPPHDGLDYIAVAERISASLGSLVSVVQSPYIILKDDYDAERAEKVGALTPEGFRKTVADPRLWKKKGDGMSPEYAYAKAPEDEYNTYENRFIKALIDRLVAFMNRPVDSMRGGIVSLYGAHANVDKLSKIDLMRLLDPDMFRESDAECFTDYRKAFYLRAKLIQLKSSGFYKIMSRCRSFSDREPEATNLLLHNPNYNACLKLWLMLNEVETKAGELKDPGISAAYGAFVFLGSVACLCNIGFSLIGDAHLIYAKDSFSAERVLLENEYFRVGISADSFEMNVTAEPKCGAAPEDFRVGIRALPETGGSKKCRYVLSFLPVEYSDDALRVRPDSEASLRELETLWKCIFFTVKVEPGVYDKLCLVCGSNAVDAKGNDVFCHDCRAAYTFFDEKTVWLKKFSVYKGKKTE